MASNNNRGGRGSNSSRGRSSSSNSGGSRSSGRGGNSSSRGKNNNPTGKNQYSWGVVEMARDNPLTATAVAAGAAAAGLFMWSRRSQISNQLSSLSDQIGQWSEDMGWTGGESEFDDTAGLTTTATDTTQSSTGARRKSAGRKSQQDFSNEALSLKETGATI